SESAASTSESRSATTWAKRVCELLISTDSFWRRRNGLRSVSWKPSDTRAAQSRGAPRAATDRARQMRKRSVSRPPAGRSDPGATALGTENRAVLLGVVEYPARAANDAREGILVHPDRQRGLLRKEDVQAANQCPTPGHHDPAIHDVTRELGRGDFK